MAIQIDGASQGWVIANRTVAARDVLGFINARTHAGAFQKKGMGAIAAAE